MQIIIGEEEEGGGGGWEVFYATNKTTGMPFMSTKLPLSEKIVNEFLSLANKQSIS
jgi:hypothetical protein